MPSGRTLKSRVAAGVAVSVAAAWVGVGLASPAEAAAPDLFVSYGIEATINNTPTVVFTYLYNYGDAPATDVSVVFDASALRDESAFPSMPTDVSWPAPS
jgi:hypothetical protein